jgi:hypothetical protein
MKSLYGNGAKLSGTEITTEKVRVFSHYTFGQINELSKDACFLSYNDDGLNDSLRYWLASRFPQPSSWELPYLFIDKIADIVQWRHTGQDYDRGCQIFK